MDEEQELKRLKQKKDDNEISSEEYELEKSDIRDRDHQLSELKQQLKNGEIDGITYNKLSYEIINRSKNEEGTIEDLENKKSHAESRIKIHFKAVIGITIVLAVVFGVIGTLEAIRASKISSHTITGINKENLPDPVQGTTSGEININIDGTDIRIEKLASYTIYGKVVSIHDYTLKKTLYEKLSPVDFTIAYGEGIPASEKLIFSTNSDRTVYPKLKDDSDADWVKQNQSIINSKISNNHLIHANDEIRNLLLNVRVGDYIKLKGYLVGVYSDQYQPWVSSLSRDDYKTLYMNPSKKEYRCEIIYVTEVDWIE